jgi:class 3 adenylate cyclase
LTVKIAQDSISEFRKVTIVFIKIVEDFSPERANKIFSTFSRCVEENDGVVQQFSVDDKGQTILACFGLPPIVHENNAQFALKATLKFMEYMSSKKFKATYAVASGDILFSELGNKLRKEASLLGDVVNISARLLSIQRSDMVICCARTHAATVGLNKHINLGLQKVNIHCSMRYVFDSKKMSLCRHIADKCYGHR